MIYNAIKRRIKDYNHGQSKVGSFEIFTTDELNKRMPFIFMKVKITNTAVLNANCLSSQSPPDTRGKTHEFVRDRSFCDLL